MTRIRPLLAGAAAVSLIAVVAAGCGGSDNGATAATTTQTAAGHQATVGVANAGELGKILVDSQGRTLYLFQRDSGMKSACSGSCATEWPPLRVSGKPTAGDGANASMLGTTARSDGQPQVTYNGHPLYTYVGDEAPGDTNGQGLTAFGGGWYVVSPAGNQVTGQASSPGGGGSNSGGGYGY